MKIKIKRLISGILSSAIFLCSCPVSAFADTPLIEEATEIIEETPTKEIDDNPLVEAKDDKSSSPVEAKEQVDDPKEEAEIIRVPLEKETFDEERLELVNKIQNALSGSELFSEKYAETLSGENLLAYALACCKGSLVRTGNTVLASTTPEENIFRTMMLYAKQNKIIKVKDLPVGSKVIDQKSIWKNDYGFVGEPIEWVKAGARNAPDINNNNIGDTITNDTGTNYPFYSYGDPTYHLTLSGNGIMFYTKFKNNLELEKSTGDDYKKDLTFCWLNIEDVKFKNHISPLKEFSRNLRKQMKKHSYGLYVTGGKYPGYRTRGCVSYVSGLIYPEFFSGVHIDEFNGNTIFIRDNLKRYEGREWKGNIENYYGSHNVGFSYDSNSRANYYTCGDYTGENLSTYYICLDFDTEVLSQPNEKGQYIIVPSDYCDTPTLVATKDSSNGTILHAVSDGAQKMEIYCDGSVVATSNGTSVAHKAEKAGEYYVKASAGEYTVESNTVVVDDADIATEPPKVTVHYNDSATPYGSIVKVNFTVEPISGTMTNVTVDGGVVLNNNGNNYNFDTTSNGVYTITAENSTGKTTVATVAVSKIDTEPPLLSVLPSTTTATNKPVTLTITASDSGSGVKEITLPNGGKYAGTSTSYEVSSNGEYSITATDNIGKTKTSKINIGNIDFELPKIDVDISTKSITKDDITATITASDNIAVDYIELPDGSKINATKATFTIDSNGSYTFKVVDKAGNENSKTIVVDKLDKDAPTIVVVKSTEEYTNQPVTLSITATDINGVDKITLPDGSDVQGGTAEYVVETNGSFAVSATDSLGTEGKQDIIIDNIDKVNPTIKITPSTTDYVKGGVKVSIQGFDNREVDKIVLEDGTEIKGDKTDIFVTENKTVKATVYDKAGNFTNGSLEVSNIDSTPPTLTYSYDDTVTKGNVEVTVIAEDDIGVKGIKLPNGVFVTGTKASFIADKNGTFTCVAIDHVGNETPEDIVICCIDRTAPKIESINIAPISKMKSLFTGSDVNVTAVANDNVAVDHIEYRVVGVDSKFKPYTKPLLFDMEINTNVEFIAYDTAGNASEKVTSDKIEVDKTAPTISYTVSTTDLTNGDIIIYLTAKDNKSVKFIKMPDGNMVEDDTAVFTATENGDYSFIAYDTVGNASDELVVKIRNIDKELPTAEFIYDSTPTRESFEVTVKASDNTGIKSITLPDGTIVNSATAKFTVDKNGGYEVKIEDIVGNITKASVSINNFDFEKPVITAVKLDEAGLLTRLLTNKSVKLTVDATDNTGIALYEYKLVNAENKAVKDWTDLGGASGVIADKDFDGKVIVRVTDGVGNASDEQEGGFTLDMTPPVISFELSTNMPTENPILVTITATDNVEVKSIKLPNGKVVEGSKANYLIRDNGNYKITATDTAGSSVTETLKISTIKGYGVPENLPFLDLDKDGKNDMLLNPPFPDGDDFVDLNGDGKDDRKDLDGDGIVDWFDISGNGKNDLQSPYLDLDGDGKNDLLLPPNPNADDFVDLNGDGIDDRKDLDGDGIVDWIDFDGDGVNDYLDTNGDGKPDWIDANGDGKNDIEKVFIDIDGDGKNDISFNSASTVNIVAEVDGAEVTIKSDAKAYVYVPTRILDEKDIKDSSAEYQTFVLNKDGSITTKDTAELNDMDSFIKVLGASTLDDVEDEGEKNPFGDRVCFKIIKEGTHEIIIKDTNDNEKIVPVTVKFNKENSINLSTTSGGGSSHTEVITKEVPVEVVKEVPVEIPVYIEKTVYKENPIDTSANTSNIADNHIDNVTSQTSSSRVINTTPYISVILILLAGAIGYYIGTKNKTRKTE